MKKSIFALLLAVSLYSCQKDRALINQNTATTWISGKWKRAGYIDTVFNGKLVAGINNFDVSLNPNELNFNTQTTGISSNFLPGQFTYSLTPLLLTYNNGTSWQVLTISDTKFRLIIHFNDTNTSWGDTYVKE